MKAPLDASGHRRYTINGRPLQIRGGGWSPDLFLRWDPTYVADKLRYTLDLGLNTIRLEGHIEPSEFFDMTDQMGILTLPGWECCDKWEGNVNGSEPGDTWSTTDFTIAKQSMADEAVVLRDHPSVISFLIGSDFAPSSTIEKNYVDALNAAAGMNAYTLTDRGTWLNFANKADLKILVEGDPGLVNRYDVVLLDPVKHPDAKHEAARRLRDWLVSPAGQAAIGAYTVHGEQLFHPSAAAPK